MNPKKLKKNKKNNGTFVKLPLSNETPVIKLLFFSFFLQITHEPRKPQSADLKDLDYYKNMPPPPPPPGRPPAHLPQPILKNPEPDMHMFFHPHPKTAQMVISPFRETPDWTLIESQLKPLGEALVCTPDMLGRGKRNLQSQQQQQQYPNRLPNHQQFLPNMQPPPPPPPAVQQQQQPQLNFNPVVYGSYPRQFLRPPGPSGAKDQNTRNQK